ncbi:MAG: hypothetical protein NTW87_05110 [Planctomycetota bacterium]|nr:hypothetical protein [Planctomycetota bacterium]
MTKTIALAIAVVISLPVVGAESGEVPAQKMALNIYIPAGLAADQLGEILRQLNVAAFVDLGRGWGNETQDLSKHILPRFSFKKGTVAEALSEYCHSRSLQWHEWKEAKALWIEPKAVAHRAAELYLQRPIREIPPAPGSPTYASSAGLHDASLEDMWKSSAEPGGESRTMFVCPYEDYEGLGFANSRNLSWDFLLRNRTLPTNMLETVRLWLAQSSPCIAALQVRDMPGVRIGPDRAVSLSLGSIDQRLSGLPPEDLLACLSLNATKRGDFRNPLARRRECLRELYRRMMVDRDLVFAAVRKAKNLDSDLLESRHAAWWAQDIMRGDPHVGGDFLLEVFSSVSREAQHKMVHLSCFYTYAKRFERLWEQLARSDDPELREAGETKLKALQTEATKKP